MEEAEERAREEARLRKLAEEAQQRSDEARRLADQLATAAQEAQRQAERAREAEKQMRLSAEQATERASVARDDAELASRRAQVFLRVISIAVIAILLALVVVGYVVTQLRKANVAVESSLDRELLSRRLSVDAMNVFLVAEQFSFVCRTASNLDPFWESFKPAILETADAAREIETHFPQANPKRDRSRCGTLSRVADSALWYAADPVLAARNGTWDEVRRHLAVHEIFDRHQNIIEKMKTRVIPEIRWGSVGRAKNDFKALCKFTGAAGCS
ncbi:hypothetical protein [Paracoccus litorisediminis]|uniref:Uncharacterized protein n=1 Tax=Paracoccus litorisediminis TaxID=2006130 RepID=A0A844HIR3_9RHOB|nr:hypothetical protein [Paracoccus litorisediminis]MTH60053.1 hypothetical protein [Paracoccus litorisediminis]